jgi:hypothetical protein
VLELPKVLLKNFRYFYIMLNPDTELVFPIRILPLLKDLRGEIWKQIITEVLESNNLVSQVGITILMIKVAGCTTCNADSYRAIRGCTLCSQQAIKRYKVPDKELNQFFRKSCNKVKIFLEKREREASLTPYK